MALNTSLNGPQQLHIQGNTVWNSLKCCLEALVCTSTCTGGCFISTMCQNSCFSHSSGHTPAPSVKPRPYMVNRDTERVWLITSLPSFASASLPTMTACAGPPGPDFDMLSSA